ncbi:MAG: hypothetical protein VX836_02795 [Pseudomonadota bacterium]|nr:hypothetical protein [Pseudomonadota bacterium]
MLTLPLSTEAADPPRQNEIQRITTKNGKVLQILDTRGEGEDSGILAGSSASKPGVIVLLVRGDDQAIIDCAKQAMLALLQMGYERIGLILTDENPSDGTDKHHITFMSRGLDAAHIRDAGSSTVTETAIIRMMRYVYDRELGDPRPEDNDPYWDLPPGTPGASG